jgi:hypothetical protein
VIRSVSIPRVFRQVRRRFGTPKSNAQAKAPLPIEYQGTPLSFTSAEEHPPVGDVLEIVRAAVSGFTPLIETEPLEPKLSMGGIAEVLWLSDMVAVSVTLPVKPARGVTVMVVVFPVVAPRATVTGAPTMFKPGVAWRGVPAEAIVAIHAPELSW